MVQGYPGRILCCRTDSRLVYPAAINIPTGLRLKAINTFSIRWASCLPNSDSGVRWFIRFQKLLEVDIPEILRTNVTHEVYLMCALLPGKVGTHAAQRKLHANVM